MIKYKIKVKQFLIIEFRVNNLTLNYIKTAENNPVDKGYHWVESWLFSTNAKQIGILYGIFALFSGLVGLSLSVLMRIELASPNPQILLHNGQLWNVLITAHALFMVFFLVMPVTMGAFGNYLVPLMIGTSDTAFPRINNIAFWFLVPSMLFAVLSCLIDEGPGTGWTIEVISCSKILLDAGNTWSRWCLINYSFWCLINYSFVFFLYLFLVVLKSTKFKNDIHIIIQKVKRFIIISRSACIYRYIHQRLNVIRPFIYYLKKTLTLFSNKNNSNLSSLEILNKNKFMKPNKTPFNFEEWLVGFTDGDGTFNIYINKKNNKLIFTYKIALSSNNLQLLNYIKSELKCGDVGLETNKHIAYFRIRDRVHLLQKVIPIFDKYPLLTSKQFNYLKFKKALLLSFDYSEKIDKIKQITEIKNEIVPNDYISNVWSDVDLNDLPSIERIMSRSWLIGFIEAEGSFYYVKKSQTPLRVVHGFGITQKKDKIILDCIRLILNIPSKVKFNRNNFYSLDDTNSINIPHIIDYFTSNDKTSILKGIKSYEFKIWKRTFYKNYGQDKSAMLLKIRDRVNYLKNKHKQNNK